MKTNCFNCGQRVALDDGVPGQTFACPACGAANTLPAAVPDSLAPESEREMWQQKRRRMTAMIAVAIFLLVALLAWLLLHPSGRNSAARQVKNAVFGSRVTEAAEQAGEGNGAEGQGQGQSGNGQQGAGEGQQGQGNNAGGQAGEQGNGAEGQGADGRNGGNRNGATNGNGQRSQPSGGAANNQSRQNGTGGNAPPERSIGWLDRFFGTQERNRPDSGRRRRHRHGSAFLRQHQRHRCAPDQRTHRHRNYAGRARA